MHRRLRPESSSRSGQHEYRLGGGTRGGSAGHDARKARQNRAFAPESAPMNPIEAALELHGELEAALADEGAGVARVLAVRPPPDLGADRVFHITLALPGSRDHTVDLPVALAMGYLADEEAAVDEWKTWVVELVGRLGL